jgi:hypothetical protein
LVCEIEAIICNDDQVKYLALLLLVLFPLSSSAAISEQKADLSPPQTIQEATGSLLRPIPKARKELPPRKEIPPQISLKRGGPNRAGPWFPYGWCTYWASLKYGGTGWSGNANQWLAGAKASGYATGSTPRVGAIIQTNEGWVGHVGYVEEVYGDGSFSLSEMNYAGFGVVSHRKLTTGDPRIVGFIY